MVLSIHSSAAFQADNNGWPSFWPPVKLPPPSPLSAASALLWSPKVGTQAVAINTSDPLYSAQLAAGRPAGNDAAPGGFQMAFLDKRIALMRFDAGHTQGGAAA